MLFILLFIKHNIITDTITTTIIDIYIWIFRRAILEKKDQTDLSGFFRGDRKSGADNSKGTTT